MSATPRLVESKEPVQEQGSAETPQGGKGRRGALVLGALAVAVLVGLGGYALLTRGQESTDNAQVQADLVPLSARVAGPVLRVHVADNARVRKGDVLVEID